jgi:apolipoprotein N-acyltransferase
VTAVASFGQSPLLGATTVCPVLIRTFAAFVAGLVLALAFEPYRMPVVVPFCIAAFVLSVRGLGARRALVPGFAFGVGFMYLLIFWMRVVGPDAWVALATLEAAFFAILGAVIALVTRLSWWPLWTATAWTASEVLRSTGTTGWMPWGRVSYAMVDTPVAAVFPWLGGNGTTLLLALLGSAIAWAAVALRQDRRVTPPVVAGVLGALVPLLAPSAFAWGGTSTGTATIAAVQGNVPGDGSDILLDHRQVTANHIDATLRLAEEVAAGSRPRPDFVVWPENSTAVDPFIDEETNAGIRRAAEAMGVPLLVGVVADAPSDDQVLNQGIVWTPDVGAGERYTKRHPVAMGEYIPYRNGLLTRMVGRLSLVPRDMLAGTRDQPLQIADIPVADAICFDVAYDDGIYDQVRNGAQVIVVQTSNATFIHTHQIEQQFAISRLRAIETGRYLVVAATNGISGVIAPDGTVLAKAETRTQRVLLEAVSLYDAVTPGVILGQWIGRASVAIAAFAAMFALFPYRRGRKTSVETKPEKIGVLT